MRRAETEPTLVARRTSLRPSSLVVCASALAWALGCGGGDDATRVVLSATPGDGNAAPVGKTFVAASVVFSPEGEQTYVNVLRDLAPQSLDYERAIELAGWADIWVHDGRVYVSSREASTITKYAVDAAGGLVSEGVASFLAYGEVDVAFWSNTFVAPDKAYMINGVSQYVVWNPQTMELTGTFELPAMPEREGFLVRAGTLDRSNVIRDGLLYQPMYWSDEDYAVFAPDSRIVVIDIATDRVVRVIEAPCAGLDIGTRDAAGNLYFSTWTSGIYQPLVLGDAGNCVARVPAGSDVAEVAFTFAELAEGREGAAVRHFQGESVLFSVFHEEQSGRLRDADDPWTVIGERNWRTWLYDPASERSAPVESLDWNSGATYVFHLGGVAHVLVPSTDYAATTVVALDAETRATELFTMRGWGIRLFEL